ncbi:MAG: hypothetical protein WCJ30_12430 [Deltaproteobacteria bacterium]
MPARRPFLSVPRRLAVATLTLVSTSCSPSPAADVIDVVDAIDIAPDIGTDIADAIAPTDATDTATPDVA